MIPRRRAKLHPYRLAFWSIALLALVVVLLDRHPITLDAGDPELSGREQSVDGTGDILIVLSATEAAAEAAAGGLDRSWVWVDLVRQEIGPVSARDIERVDAATLGEHRLVVLTRAAARAEAAQARADELEAFVHAGGVLALEIPEGALRTRFAADGLGGWRRADTITAAEGVPDSVLEQMRNIPLLTRYRGSTGSLAEANTLLAMDGAPVIYTRRIGAGQAVVFDFEVGAQLSRMQQGTPGDGFSVEPRRRGQPIRTFDLASTPAMIGATVPYADLLERYIAHVVFGDHEPMFALWPYPNGKVGALLTSHDARRIEGRPLWMSIHERSLDARSTTFVAAPPEMPPDGHTFPDVEFVGHAAMLWVLDPDDAGLYRRHGFLGFEPVRQSLTLGGQLEQLEAALGDDADVRGVRVWDGRWADDFTEPYRIMDAAELRYSATYGPPAGVPPGFLFGTCQPFTPIDRNGHPFRLQEVPVCFADPESEEELALFDEAMQTAARDAWAVHLLTSADLFHERPALAAFDGWRSALRFAERSDMWVGGAGEFVSFQRRRSASALHATHRQVTSTTAEGQARVVEYTVEVETDGRGLVLMVPARVGGLSFEQATRGGPEARQYDVAGQVDTSTATYLGREVRLVSLNPGFTTVGLRYRR